MMNSEVVEQAIREAFARTPRPAPDQMVEDSWDDEGTAFGQFINEHNYTWETLATEPSDTTYVGFCWLTPQGFRYFLPGLLINAVRNPTGHAADTLISFLARPKRQLIDSWEARAKVLSETERAAIVIACHFLRESVREKCSSEWEFTESTLRRDLDKIPAIFDVTVAELGDAATSADHDESAFYSRFGQPTNSYSIGKKAYFEYTCRDGRITLHYDRALFERDHLLRTLAWQRRAESS